MINRIKLDVFYIENWALVLDFKIIFQTVLISLKEKKSVLKWKTTCIDDTPLIVKNLLLKPYNRCKIKLIRIGK
jgi:hypothetical protein